MPVMGTTLSLARFVGLHFQGRCWCDWGGRDTGAFRGSPEFVDVRPADEELVSVERTVLTFRIGTGGGVKPPTLLPAFPKPASSSPSTPRYSGWKKPVSASGSETDLRSVLPATCSQSSELLKGR